MQQKFAERAVTDNIYNRTVFVDKKCEKNEAKQQLPFFLPLLCSIYFIRGSHQRCPILPRCLSLFIHSSFISSSAVASNHVNKARAKHCRIFTLQFYSLGILQSTRKALSMEEQVLIILILSKLTVDGGRFHQK